MRANIGSGLAANPAYDGTKGNHWCFERMFWRITPKEFNGLTRGNASLVENHRSGLMRKSNHQLF